MNKYMLTLAALVVAAVSTGCSKSQDSAPAQQAKPAASVSAIPAAPIVGNSDAADRERLKRIMGDGNLPRGKRTKNYLD